MAELQRVRSFAQKMREADQSMTIAQILEAREAKMDGYEDSHLEMEYENRTHLEHWDEYDLPVEDNYLTEECPICDLEVTIHIDDWDDIVCPFCGACFSQERATEFDDLPY